MYFGDASRNELLELAGAKRARAFVATLASSDATERMVSEILKLRPRAVVLARAKDSEHAARLATLGATYAIAEAIEASLQLAGHLLQQLDFPEEVAERRIADVRAREVAAIKHAAKKARKAARAAPHRLPD